MSANEERIVEIEVKLAYHDQGLEDLHKALVDKEARITVLEDKIEKLEKALRILAQRVSAPKEDVVGAHPEEDPVPRSG